MAHRFDPSIFGFLRDLKDNNKREWFQANKKRYETECRDQMLDFIQAFAEPLAEISPAFIANPKPVGGSLFRIYRDTRFGKDKTPYKTNSGAQFRHERGKDAHAPGFYLHIEPGAVFAAAGIWHPDNPTLGKIRDAIVAKPERWQEATRKKTLGKGVALSGASLKRPPRGYDPEHPLIEDLKRKDYIAVTEFSEADALKPGFMKKFTGFCEGAAPLTNFITDALDLEF